MGARPNTEARQLYHAWVAMEDRANEEGDSEAVTEANHLAMGLVRAPITSKTDLAMMVHSLHFQGDAYDDPLFPHPRNGRTVMPPRPRPVPQAP